MSQDQLDALIARLANDPAFDAAMAAAASVDDAQRIAAEYGFDVTAEQFAAAASNGDLSDAELEVVTGGGPWTGGKYCF